MKTFMTFLLAFIGSLIAGAAVITLIAERTGGDETFILAFMAEALVTSVVTLVLVIAYIAAPGPHSVSMAALGLVALYLALTAAVVALDIWSGGLELAWSDLPLFGAACLSGLIVIAVQWWLVRRRAIRVVGGAPIIREAAG
ncbi:MAG: hypothetical protein J0H01_31760 [Rhizobiales bacterium]|nr:hypothetical protein [Hyphomicrobiales bacterium]